MFIIGESVAQIKGGAYAGFRRLNEDDDAYYEVGEAIFITGIESPVRGNGEGSRLLGELTKWADSKGVKLALIPAATPCSKKGGLNQVDLVAWYIRHGFNVEGDYMSRSPKV